MSVDFNSVINNAMLAAAQRRNQAASISTGVVNPNDMQNSGRSSELTMEDIASAMKAKNAQKHDDSKFITTHGHAFKITQDEDTTTAIGANVQTTISAIQASTEVSLARQNEISNGLKSYHDNPYVK